MDPFEAHGVVPDVIDAAPDAKIKVTFYGATSEYGNELTPTQVKNMPVIVWPTEAGAMYTLVMTDPDAPSRADPNNGEFLHWLVTNIPGNDISKGDDISGYIGSGPPQDTGLHRYVFLAYKQLGKLAFEEPLQTSIQTTGRPKFSIRKFAAKYNLGSPVAGNFFQAQYDDYVPVLYATFV